MADFCCFTCPAPTGADRTLDDLCPSCGRALDFPISSPPKSVDRYQVIKPLGRGFYAATFLASHGLLDTKVVLKVSSRAIYDSFKKDFAAECRKHQQVAQGTEHLVPIEDMLDTDVYFDDLTIPCHVAVLRYVQGSTLTKYLGGETGLTAKTAAQIGIDLFRILGDLDDNGVHHNDLHGDNIVIADLEAGSRRHGAVDDRVRAMAIDLGSVSDASKSDAERLGDLHWIASHLQEIAKRLFTLPDHASDLEFRLTNALVDLAHFLLPPVQNQRTPSFRDCEAAIHDAVKDTEAPWRQPLSLHGFSDSYNAQTLAPWYVPALLVDPDDNWVTRISGRGPQLLTGMRGCGKTLLLRALEFHARAARLDGETEASQLLRVTDDHFLGLYVSSTKLLHNRPEQHLDRERMHTRLFVEYALQAVRAVRHLSDVVTYDQIAPDVAGQLSSIVASMINGAEHVRESTSIGVLERHLLDMRQTFGNGNSIYTLKSHPATAFPELARALRRCSSAWENRYVLFLLDDVSTRNLSAEEIEHLISAVLFLNEDCAFKLSTETQTVEFVLRSPGEIEKAQRGRDYDVFDLGREVNKRMRGGRRGGPSFVEEVLQRRAKYYPDHPDLFPRDVLGDTDLESIARKIATVQKTAREKKAIYHGISALRAVCVGDVGDVIKLYEAMLLAAQGIFPIPPQTQSECYQDYCARRLYGLNRRSAALKDFALSFAQASHELLRQSHRAGEGTERRLRQYLKIYVRVTTDNISNQLERLRELIDAGVFVLTGGSDTPRTKTKDADPVQQFVLTYRKLFGLSSFIGLAERDRFELSGEDLLEWLQKPADGRNILTRRLGGADPDDIEETTAKESKSVPDSESEDDHRPEEVTQVSLFAQPTVEWDVRLAPALEGPEDSEALRLRRPECTRMELEELQSEDFDHLVVAMGFEDRAQASVNRLLGALSVPHCVVVQYDDNAGKAILDAVKAKVERVDVLSYRDLIDSPLNLNVPLMGRALVDVSGLAKPAIFALVRNCLTTHGNVSILHTSADTYYPRNSDIQTVLQAEEERDHYGLLESLSRILTGETGPYDVMPLLESDADTSRRAVLCAFSSAKHERLMTLTDSRDFEQVEVVVPAGKAPRSQIARIAGEVVIKNVPSGNITDVSTHDLAAIVSFLSEQYQKWYHRSGFNFEMGLTGTKFHAVAAAAIASSFKVSQCWYVRPSRFDRGRFTEGKGPTVAWQIRNPTV